MADIVKHHAAICVDSCNSVTSRLVRTPHLCGMFHLNEHCLPLKNIFSNPVRKIKEPEMGLSFMKVSVEMT